MVPDCNTQRTNAGKSVTELIFYYYRFNEKRKVLCKGENPDFIPANKIFTQREWCSHLSKAKKKNPILEAYKYLEYLER